MLSKVKEKIHKITKAAGIEITLLQEGQYKILLTVLTLSKNSIVLEKKESILDGKIESLKEVLEKDTPVYVVLNGRGILHKKITDSGSDTASLIQSVLPNAKVQDFYIQTSVAEKSSLVSIIRKELVDPILIALESNQWHCIGLSLGGSVVKSIVSLISEEVKTGLFNWSSHSIELDKEGSIVDYKQLVASAEKKYFKLDTEKVEDDYLLSYAAAFSILVNTDPQEPFVDRVILVKEEYLNKLLFQKLSWSVLVLFLVVLMVNFILFTNFSSKNNELSQKESKYSSLFSEMENLSKEVKEKEAFLSEAGWLKSSSNTFYADRIAASVPSSVKLTEFSINPLDERKSKEEKKELFSTGVILLKGDCTRPTELNEWLDKIKSIDKITKAKLVNYSYDTKENKGSFRIEIETKN